MQISLMRRILFALATVFVGSGCLCGGCGCPPKHGYPHGNDYRNAEMEYRQARAQPVIDALEKYKAERGHYPETLDELVSARLLDQIPSLNFETDHQEKKGRIKDARPLDYLPGEKHDTFKLRIDFTFTEFSMQDPRYVCTYDSEKGKWWRGGTSTAPLTRKVTNKN